ncbi:MAG TPA: 3-hydroxyacyl-CoA dehydrogenase [Synergistaceae bacterium]|nr:3-hydroxyacyl-CoA dehydrogenase [Synergistaceae bacterium]
MEVRKMAKVVATVGVGTVGSSWATFYSSKGFKVKMYDAAENVLKLAPNSVQRNLEFMIERGLMPREEADAALQNIESCFELSEAVCDATFIQESAFESYEVKEKLFEGIEEACPRDTIIASSSSGLLMTNIQKNLKTPERCVICHPFNPPHLLPLVEIVPGEKTSTDTLRRAKEFFEGLGKVPVILKKEMVGHIANRLSAALWREAIHLVVEGVASVEDVDKAVWAGPGLRWAFMGPHLTYHLGGGKGGLKYFLEHLGPAFESYFEDLGSWTRIPEHAKPKLVEGVIEEVQGKSIDDLVKWRDAKLAEVLKAVLG